MQRMISFIQITRHHRYSIKDMSDIQRRVILTNTEDRWLDTMVKRYITFCKSELSYSYAIIIEDALIADYLMSTLSSLQPVFNQKPFKNKIAAVIIPSPLRGPFGNPQQVSQGIHSSETAGPSDKDATTITEGVSIGTIVKDLAASDADVTSLGPAVPL